MDLVDIGANLTHRDFAGDLPEVIERARSAGVARIVVTGTSEAESLRAAALAERYPGTLFATAGVHPHDARGWTGHTQRAIEDLLARPGVVAIGEAGLDYYRDYSPRPQQERVFEAQIELAADRGVAVFLHERGAHRRFVAILSRYRDRIPRAVVHCFTGTRDELWAYLDLDLHIGITGWICDERRGLHLRELVPAVPAGRLMIESDAPYLLPRTLPRSGPERRNEPVHLVEVLRVVAAALDQAPEAVAAATTGAAEAFFALPRRVA
jgi:TatD DNase family protein